MKIAMVTEHFLPRVGGVEIYTYELSKKLLEMGNEVHIITPRTERITFGDRKYTLGGLIVHRFSGFKIPWVNVSFTPFTPFKLKAFFKEEKFDVVHGQQVLMPIVAGAASGASLMYPPADCVVVTNHSVYVKGVESLVFKFWERPLRRVLSQVDRVIAVSKPAAEAMVPIVDGRKIVIIPNGVDIQTFSPKNKGTLDLNGPIVMGIGRLVNVKGFDVLLKAAQIILSDFPRAKFVIVGEGKAKRKLAFLAEKLGIKGNVHFLGKKKHGEMPNLLASCDVFVLPSRKESAGRVVLEAMASGKAIVGTKVSGIQDMIRSGENGLLVKPDNPQQLSIAIKKFLSDQKLTRRLGGAARKAAVEKYDWKHVAKKTFFLYKEIIEEKR